MEYVTLTTAEDMYHAHFLAQALDEEGILYIQANEHIATMLPHLRQGIQVRVKKEDFERAKIISDRIDEMRRLRCPKCDSTDLKYLGVEARPLTFGEKFLRFMRVPITAQALVYGCTKCHHTFTTK